MIKQNTDQIWTNIDGLVQHCINSSVLAVELLQSCTKPSISGYVTMKKLTQLR